MVVKFGHSVYIHVQLRISINVDEISIYYSADEMSNCIVLHRHTSDITHQNYLLDE